MEKQRILVLGGTHFIGRNLIGKLLEKGEYDITLFNRGKTNSDLYPSVKRLVGDRNTADIRLIGQSDWDFIIDLSCYFPNSLEQILEGLKPSLKKYILISSCSVYENEYNQTLYRNEESEILKCSPTEKANPSDSTYGKRKAESERVLVNSGVDYTILRPSLVYGRYDTTDRLYYWLYQAKNEDEILIADDGSKVFSITYVHDLVKAIIQSINQSLHSNIYNVITKSDISIKQIVQQTSQLLNTQNKFSEISGTFLKQNNIREWMDLPLWLDCDYFTYSNEKIKRDYGFKFTDFQTSLKETIQYYDKLKWPTSTFGITKEKRAALIKSYTAKTDQL